MKKVVIFVFLLVVCSCKSATAQSNTINHVVEKGDTVTNLAKKYGITPYDIYALNPEAQNGINLGTTLIIPKKGINNKQQFHKVEAKETLFGISQKYGITLSDLEDANKDLLVNGLQPGQELVIPNTSKKQVEVKEHLNSTDLHVVAPKETIYSITTKYGITALDLEKLNPQLKDGLKAGDTLRIAKVLNVIDNKASNQVVKLPGNSEKKANHTSLKFNNKDRKEIVVFLPFNASKIDLANTEGLHKNVFLNLTLDLYAGMLVAVDSVKKSGGNFSVTFYDSEETQSTSSVESIIASNDFSNVDVVIGPLFQANVEKVASLLKNQNTAIISPLSKDGKKGFSNIYRSIPPADVVKIGMLDYLKNKDAKILAVVDAKKVNSKNLIQTHLPQAQLVPFSDAGAISENLKAKLQKGKTNYVILETESMSVVQRVTNFLVSQLSEFDIKLVTLERNNAFESVEVHSSTLARLNMHYPSIVNESNSDYISSFSYQYKKENNIFPNQYAVRGFDLMYDTFVRLSQGDDFNKVADSLETEQTENKFSYVKSSDGGYYNSGVFILYYDNDLTIKLAK